MTSPAPIFLRRPDEPLARLLAAVAIAMALHALLAGTLAVASTLGWLHGTPVPKPPENVALVSVSASQWDANRALIPPESMPQALPVAPAPPRREPLPHGQVVDVSGGNHQRPDAAAYLAEDDNRVAKQTRSRDQTRDDRRAMPTRTSALPAKSSSNPPAAAPGQHGNRGTASDDRTAREGSHAGHEELPGISKQQLVAMAATDPRGEIRTEAPSDRPVGNAPRLLVSPGDLEKLADDPGSLGHAGDPGDTSTPSAGDPAPVSGAPSNDQLDQPEGDATWLNTRAFRYAQFFNRIKQRVSEQWDVDQVLRRHGRSAPVEATTVLAITLDTQGRLVDASIARGSGVPFLDEEAVAAFERAAPFLNPPQALFDAGGRLRFLFGFYVETANHGGGFQIFRGRD